MYKCHACGRQFQGGDRRSPQIIFRDYLEGKQTYAQLAAKYHCSARTIQRCIDKAKPGSLQKGITVANVVIDTTYFSDTGVMVFKNSLDGKTLLVRIVNNETVRGYVEGIEHIKGMGYSVQAIVADGRRGIFNAFKDIPVQLCHFHQVKTVTKYLTKRPKLEASKELRQLSLLLKCSDRRSFENSLDVWYAKWHETLDERTFFREGRTGTLHIHAYELAQGIPQLAKEYASSVCFRGVAGAEHTQHHELPRRAFLRSQEQAAQPQRIVP